ncbi:aquaporin [Homoserinibacter sp. GY 40078]|uniref:aquaporin n=1 Tax=Homoserinibacter sp. GY 40078 TaxID=2603275 RepID=UPI0011C9F19D|nr:aquaporin [Homoserinibacter sp. GY 40078]TXK16286.1 aquaporin [Homoserinibacter sp. GY 40078]
MSDDAAPAPLVRRLIAETFGTYVLVFAVLGAALFFTPDNGGALPVALGVGLGVLAAAYAVGHISGGHFNPAITLGAAVAGRSRWVDVLPYWVAQIVGAIFAVLTFGLWGIVSGKTIDFGAVSNGFDGHSPAGFTLWAVLIAEIVATFLFVTIVLGVTAAGATTAGFAPLAIGLGLTMLHFVMIPISNASLNPARSIAPALLGGPEALGQLWVFLVAPLVGGLLAGVLHRPLFGATR